MFHKEKTGAVRTHTEEHQHQGKADFRGFLLHVRLVCNKYVILFQIYEDVLTFVQNRFGFKPFLKQYD